jgi:GntR family transcriptional regulator
MTLQTSPKRVRRDTIEPLYVQIERNIAEEIASGALSAGAPIPSESTLMELYGVSRPTVRQALGTLRFRGLIESSQGRGSFVRMPPASRVSCLASFTEHSLASGHVPGARLLRYGEMTDADAARQLDCSPEETLLSVVRLRTLDGVPAFLSFAYIPSPYWLSIPRESLRSTGSEQSLYRTIESCCGVRLAAGQEVVAAVAADSASSQILGVPEGAPIVERTCVLKSDDMRSILYERALWVVPKESEIKYERMTT